MRSSRGVSEKDGRLTNEKKSMGVAATTWKGQTYNIVLRRAPGAKGSRRKRATAAIIHSHSSREKRAIRSRTVELDLYNTLSLSRFSLKNFVYIYTHYVSIFNAREKSDIIRM